MKTNKKFRIIGILAVICVCLILAAIGKAFEQNGKISILDDAGQEIGCVTYEEGQLSYDCREGYLSYGIRAVAEAVEIVMEKEHTDASSAQKMLLKKNAKICTYLSEEIQSCLMDSAKDRDYAQKMAFTVSVCDIRGKLLGAYALNERGEEYDGLEAHRYAASAIKPISVYAPALETGMITCSDQFPDAPVKQIRAADGTMTDWPSNTTEYTGEPICVQKALKYSNNAVAVRLLQEYGVENACDFLAEMFSIDTEPEKKQIQNTSGEEVLAHLALGYLQNGVTQLEMLSAYEIFANAGQYQKVSLVKEINLEQESMYDNHTDSFSQILSEETACIMNRMLCEVVTGDGTGADAAVDGLEICGKTGTSDEFHDNWFIGFSPEYLCAVWYGSDGGSVEIKNRAPEWFHDIMAGIRMEAGKTFPECEQVQEAVFCEKTGLRASEFCEKTSVGYYKPQTVPPLCTCGK